MLPLKLAATVSAVAYLFARLVFTWHEANPVMFTLLLGAEMFGVWRLWIEIGLMGEPRAESRSPATGPAPSADAVVVVTDEPASEVRAAVLSVRAIDGIGKVWIADRDNRRDVTELARRLGIEMIKGGADAVGTGPIVNECLKYSTSMLTVMVPADMVALPDLLTASTPFFVDPGVGVLICRVENTNAARIVDYGGYGIDEIRDRLMVPRLDAARALPWIPGLAVFRRQELLDCGGLGSGPGMGTLDAGMRLASSRVRVSESPVVVARRLASWTDDRKLHRWSRTLEERLTFLKTTTAASRRRSLPRLTRRWHAEALIHALQPIQRAVLFGVLMATLFTSSLPLTGDVIPLGMLWFAWHASSLLLRREASREVGFIPWITGDLRLATTNMSVAWRVMRGRPIPQSLEDTAPGRHARTGMLVVVRVALIGAILAFGSGMVRTAHGDFVTFAALAFDLWMLMATLMAGSGMKLGQVRQSFRTFEELRVLEGGSKMAVVGVSPSGIDVVTRRPMTIGEAMVVAFALPQPDGEDVKFACPAVVRRSGRQGRYHMSYLAFSHLGDNEFDQILMYCSVVAGTHLLRDPKVTRGTDTNADIESGREPETSRAEMVADEA